MSKWITDRRPTEADGSRDQGWVFDERGYVVDYSLIMEGEPWKPIPKCEPYVKPKSWTVRKCNLGDYDVHNDTGLRVAMNIPTREAAIRIAAIYQEAKP